MHQQFLREFTPVKRAKSDTFEVFRDHGLETSIRLHNPRDPINKGLANPILVEYIIRRNSQHPLQYPVYTLEDLAAVKYPTVEVDKKTAQGYFANVVGLQLAERISRRITRYMLQHIPEGRIEPLFKEDFKTAHEYVVASTDRYVLKTFKNNYPNMILLEKTGQGKFGYEPIKEIDGFFSYRYFGTQQLIIIESKLDTTAVKPQKLTTKLFGAMHELFPKSHLNYVLFTSKRATFSSHQRESRILKAGAKNLHIELKKHGVRTIFFTFNETTEEMNTVASHVIAQHRYIHDLPIEIHGTLEKGQLTIYNGGDTPLKQLVRDPNQEGVWKEVSYE